jgi:hypothetical protein
MFKFPFLRVKNSSLPKETFPPVAPENCLVGDPVVVDRSAGQGPEGSEHYTFTRGSRAVPKHVLRGAVVSTRAHSVRSHSPSNTFIVTDGEQAAAMRHPAERGDSPFGGLLSDSFTTPVDHTGNMVFAGVRYNFPKNDGRTKIGFEFNHGSKYGFNFAQAEDDILAPKTATRGEVYEGHHKAYPSVSSINFEKTGALIMAQPSEHNQQFRTSYPNVWDAFSRLAEECHSAGPLDKKTAG